MLEEDSTTPPDREEEGDDYGSWRVDLSQIPRERWRETLAPMPSMWRYWNSRAASNPDDHTPAGLLAVELEGADRERAQRRRQARRTSGHLPAPGADHPAARPTVQVGLRLRADDHSRLAEAAELVGLRPTSLGRALILNGVSRILQEHGREG